MNINEIKKNLSDMAQMLPNAGVKYKTISSAIELIEYQDDELSRLKFKIEYLEEQLRMATDDGVVFLAASA